MGTKGSHTPPARRQDHHQHRPLRQQPFDDAGSLPLTVAYSQCGAFGACVVHVLKDNTNR
jgi:hypothetical protein